MNILGIESSCDETAAAIVNDQFKILSSVVSSQIDLHRVTQGVVPEVAARAHTEKIIPVIDAALKKARFTFKNIDAIAVTRGPGLITSLLVGVETAKSLAFALNKPIIGINHIEGHVLSNLLVQPANQESQIKIDKKRLPLVVLTVSGGHTELILLKQIGDFKLLGRTRDDAAGEAFDKVAKLLGLPYPGGPSISQAALKGNPTRFVFPRPMLKAKNFDFSFSGLKTAVVQAVEKIPVKKRKALIPDIAASFQQAVIDTLLGKAQNALTRYAAKEFWLVGGVAANQELRKQAERLAQQKKIQLKIPSFELCTDNAVMIAAVGVFKYKQGLRDKIDKLAVNPALDLVV